MGSDSVGGNAWKGNDVASPGESPGLAMFRSLCGRKRCSPDAVPACGLPAGVPSAVGASGGCQVGEAPNVFG